MTIRALIRSLILPIAIAAVPAAAAAPLPELDKGEYEDMFALASDCSVALSVLEENGAEIESEPTDWMNVLMNLGERLDRDPYMEYMFRQTEISALLEVEPEQTSNWVTDTADECASLLPSIGSAHADASQGGVSRSSS